jgi:hypothetical protein
LTAVEPNEFGGRGKSEGDSPRPLHGERLEQPIQFLRTQSRSVVGYFPNDFVRGARRPERDALVGAAASKSEQQIAQLRQPLRIGLERHGAGDDGGDFEVGVERSGRVDKATGQHLEIGGSERQGGCAEKVVDDVEEHPTRFGSAA